MWHSRLVDEIYSGRLAALEQIWRIWAELGESLTEEQWSTATRCPGWDVAALYAHHSAFPLALSAPLPPRDDPMGEPVTAGEILRGFNAPDGVAHTMAGTVADHALSQAAALTRNELVDRFGVHGPCALQRLRQAEATLVVPWPASRKVIMLGEALRIVVMEATVHLLDVRRALGQPPAVPAPALKDTVQLLAELAPAVELIEAAAGRSTRSHYQCCADAEWGVSMQARIERARGLGLITAAQRTNLYKSLSARGWRTTEPLSEEIPPETPALTHSIDTALAGKGYSLADIARLAGFSESVPHHPFLPSVHRRLQLV